MRRRIGWRRGVPAIRAEAKGRLFDYLEGRARRDAERREAELRQRYALEPLHASSSRWDYRDNVGLADVLERLLDGATYEPVSGVGSARLRVCDVGAKNWCYVFALQRVLRSWGGGEVDLLGVEIDGYPVYRDGYSRADWAEAYIAQVGGATRYTVSDFRQQQGEFDVVTIFYPFVTRYALLRWGLPLHLYQPRAILDHAVARLRPGGALIALTQTDDECQRVVQMASASGARLVRSLSAASDLVSYRARCESRRAVLLRREE
ncbi:MAG: hypothetical protein AAF628_07370 [Planctomycetota bacterium]